jgi:microcystin-dependent protein
MTIPAQTPRSGPYSGNGSTTAFGYGFLVKLDTEIVVTVADAAGAETIKTLTTDYTVSGVGNSAGGDITFVTAPISTEEVVVTRTIAMTQATDLQNRKSVVPQVLEDAYDKLTRITQDHKEQIDRSIKVDIFGNVDLAALTLDLAVVAGIASEVATVAADGTDIGVVAGISANVNTVGGIAADVTAVAAIDADVTTVAADSTDIGVVAGISANVNTVGGIAADVTAVAAIDADVTTVAADGTDIGVVAGISAYVTTVGGIAADVTAVAAIDADVTTVADNIAAVQGADAAATAAANSAAAAEASFDSFDDRYLGSFATAPTVDNDGNTILEGAIYWNTTSKALFIRNGSAAWSGAVFDTAGAMFGANNGSDFDDVALVRDNIGLGTAATTEAADYATAGQGTLADTALQPDGDGSGLTGIVGTPTGAVLWFAADAAPTGFIKANGAAISRSTYADLFAITGTTFGAGDGSTTFLVPDLRGEFVRGWDDARGIDAGRTFGSAQADELKSHSHSMRIQGSSGGGITTGAGSLGAGSNTGDTDAEGGAETRGRNVALLACIKY